MAWNVPVVATGVSHFWRIGRGCEIVFYATGIPVVINRSLSEASRSFLKKRTKKILQMGRA
jgi:hypothetical protein